ncbi:stage II sporulation protein E, protein serine/threonine phosphatase [Caldalkalibacillus thermarum TA2.A1]|uniref:Stage II sporulation protein E n=1 Tax=Caldalkalibacillus thermarum (strain TA2.A1) TaxID=986075 RepID=F5LA05_CALTT|nr:stage II sporulation protein E [Caldalkalibacillus thermarum]EGL81875.1 stage II sporulation protein E, protein serine/threonine phosphatase [Caldalkalibacillus thermarum TA2.A1]QZT34362.1 stage II sporulation protein E [Caldalkalibacillus thermarum TA2.A1]
MRKLESSVSQSVWQFITENKGGMARLLRLPAKVKARLFQQWGLAIFLAGFLLGRALIIGEIAPFVIPFIAVVYHLRRDKLFLASLSTLLGAASHELASPFKLLVTILFFIGLQKLLERWHKGAISYTPIAVFMAVLLVNLGFAYVKYWTGYTALMAAVEALLSLVLTLIFVQSVPLMTNRKRKAPLRNEELVCLVILLASLMTGTVGWMVIDISLEHVLSRYAILVFALAAGGAIGATVGVVTGIILSLANVEAMLEMSLLAFSGLLGGLLKEGKKIGVATGLLIGTLLMGLYLGETGLWSTFYESVVAIMLFFLTPKKVFMTISQYIPGTPEHAALEQEYMKRLRDVTAKKVEQFAELFQQLAKSFSHKPTEQDEERRRHVDLLLSQVTEHTCQVCFKKEQCWQGKFQDTYQLMGQVVDHMENHGELSGALRKEWNQYCMKAQKVMQLIGAELEKTKILLKYKQLCQESRRLVADQLSGVSRVMTNFAREIKREAENHQVQEQVVLDALEELGLSIRYVDIISLDEGNVEIELSLPLAYGREECEKIVAPLLSDLVGEPIMVDKEESVFATGGYSKVRLVSAKRFKVSIGVASAAKGGGLLSGDSFNTMAIGPAKYAVAIADGMGNGERAHQESRETLNLLQYILQSGIEETVAIKSINAILSLRSPEEVFSTLDLAVIDLHTAQTKFIKIGSTPSFIKRGDQCLSVAAHNLPIGILQDIDVDVVSEQLKAGDLLVMMTDGLFDAPRHIENKERWMRRLIAEIETNDPQEVADLLLEKVIRFSQGKILDDMTVVVAKVERHIPEWSTISLTHIPKLRSTKGELLAST